MINLQPNEQQQIIVDSVTEFLATELPVARFNPKENRGNVELQVWDKMAELGWFQLLLPEEFDGFGLGNAEAALIGEAFGRFLVSPTVIATVIGARLAAAAGRRDLIDQLTQGSRRAALACPAAWQYGDKDAAGDVLITDGQDTSLFVYFTGDQIQLREYVGTSEPPGRLTLACFDSTLPLERISLDQSTLVYSGDQDCPFVVQLVILLAAMLAGVAAATRDMAVDYAKIRQQFGRPIGGFQVIKHMCADLAIRAQSASTLAIFAAVNTDLKAAGAKNDASSALIVAAKAAIENAENNIQIHGGFGFTAECSAHNYLKRATLIQNMAGGLLVHQDALLTHGNNKNVA